jgi:phage shock protein A
MRTNYNKLQTKLKETEARCELLIAQNRRARTVGRANQVQTAPTGKNLTRSMDRMRMQVLGKEAANSASQILLEADSPTPIHDSLDERLLQLERDDQIESLLNEIKSRPGRTGAALVKQ